MSKGRNGQAALIMILLTAVAIILFAITLNWGSIAQIKTLTLTSSTTAVSGLASSYASYGEMQLQTSLGGKQQICKSNGILAALITLIIVAILVVACAATGGVACAAFPAVLAITSSMMAVAVLLLAAASLALQMVVIQPGLTRLWNAQQAGLPLTGQFLEGGLRTGLQGVVTDNVTMNDYGDSNSNGKFGKGVDVISRYAFYYTERNLSLKPWDASVLNVFLTGLSNFNQGLVVPCTDCNDPRCNSCCVPVEYRMVSNACGECGVDPVPPMCSAATGWPYVMDYPLSYDWSQSDYISGMDFLARFGIDAQVRPFNQSDAKGLFSLFWDMDAVLTDPNTAPDLADAMARRSDAVDQIPNFKAQDDQCVETLNPAEGIWWKKGIDMYCSTIWPYDSTCAKYSAMATCDPASAASCGCTTATAATDWPEDYADDLVLGLRSFFVWSETISSFTEVELRANLDQWYKDAAMWMGPQCNGTNDTFCYAGRNGEGGFLYTYRNRLTAMKTNLDDWLNKSFANDQAWCVPLSPVGLSVEEVSVITANRFQNCLAALNDPAYVCDPALPPLACQNLPFSLAALPTPPVSDLCAAAYPLWLSASALANNVAWGSLGGAIACLDYNATNAIRFQTCLDDLNNPAYACDAALPPLSCQNLPRSLSLLPAPTASELCATAYPAWLTDSAALAVPQGIKFAARAATLQRMKTQAENQSRLIEGFLVNLDCFLGISTFPWCGDVRVALANVGNEPPPASRLMPYIIYGWQDPQPPKSGSRAEGYWHIARVEALSPGECSIKGTSALCQDASVVNHDKLPWVKTSTKGFLGSTRCYTLTDHSGKAMARVTRWDEDRGQVFFANRFPIWKFLNQKPGLLPDVQANLDTLNTNCRGRGVTPETLGALFNAGVGANLNDPDWRALRGAFMLNRAPDGAVDANSQEAKCWQAANAFLKRGVSSQTCAQYFLDPLPGVDGNRHMSLKFIPCPPGAFDADTLQP